MRKASKAKEDLKGVERCEDGPLERMLLKMQAYIDSNESTARCIERIRTQCAEGDHGGDPVAYRY